MSTARTSVARPPASKAPAKSGVLAAIGRLPTATLLGVVVALLCIIGLVMVGSASSLISISLYGSPWSIFIREGMWMAAGVLVLVAVIRIDYRKMRRLSPLLMVGTVGLLLIVLVPGIGVHVQGSSRWVGFGQFRIQPSELMKLSLVM